MYYLNKFDEYLKYLKYLEYLKMSTNSNSTLDITMDKDPDNNRKTINLNFQTNDENMAKIWTKIFAMTSQMFNGPASQPNSAENSKDNLNVPDNIDI